jgi:AraC-like DNA-binding protein
VKLYIKNMVCVRCKLVVKSELEKLGLHFSKVELGEAEIMEDIAPDQLKRLDSALRSLGLELMDDRKSVLVEKIKTIIIELVHYSDEQIKINLSDYLSDKLNHNYSHLSTLFSEVRGITIEQFYLEHKIEKVKELLVYDELNLTEIAYRMHYSSVAHLSNQFKKMTGMTPSHFKNLKYKSRIALSDM